MVLVGDLIPSLETATALLAVATFTLALFAGVQAWFTRKLADAAVQQLAVAAPPSLHLAPHDGPRRGTAADLTEDGELRVWIQNLGQAAAHVRSAAFGEVIYGKPTKARRAELDSTLEPGGRRYVVVARLKPKVAADLRKGEARLRFWISYLAEGSGARYTWTATLTYEPAPRRKWLVLRERVRVEE